MRKTIATLLFLALVQCAFGQDIVQFKVSKPYCIFNFLQTATREQGTSSTLSAHIISNTKGDTTFAKVCADFAGIQLDYQYKRAEFPQSRRQHRSTKDLVIIALVGANTLEEFQSNSVGILPNSEQGKLVNTLKHAEGYYDRIIWDSSNQKLRMQQEALQKYAVSCSEIFTAFQQFCNSSWSADIPFRVSLYPIPGVRGNSTATAFANSLCVGVLTGDSEPVGTVGVVVHEMCHVLYDEQPKAFQYQIEKWFEDSKLPYAQYAYNFFDEGLATALGNGWAYKHLSGHLDTAAWYDNEYIDGFGKALYPLVEKYLAVHQQIDEPFIDSAIALFAKNFPHSVSDYGILLNRSSIYSDAQNDSETGELMNIVGNNFQLTNVSLSSPILEKESLELLKGSKQTQLIVITQNHKENLSALKKIFPQLSTFIAGKVPENTIFSFYDRLNRPVIILYANGKEDLPALVRKMEDLKYFDGKKLIQN